MSAALKRNLETEKLSRKPPLGEKRPRLRLVWENPNLTAGTQKEKPEARPGSSYGRVLYNYFRYYDPATGRYITSDPIGLRGGLNAFAYIRNNPLRYIDPFGLYPKCESYILGITTKEWQDFDEIILFQFRLPVPIPVGVGIGPDLDPRFPKKFPIRPEIQFDLWEVEYTLASQKIYSVTQVIQHLKVFCTETREDKCGNTKTFNTNFEIDNPLDPVRKLIDERLDWRYEKIRLLGSAGF